MAFRQSRNCDSRRPQGADIPSIRQRKVLALIVILDRAEHKAKKTFNNHQNLANKGLADFTYDAGKQAGLNTVPLTSKKD
jgi:hypothetical protein